TDASAAINISSIARVSNVVTVNTSSPHQLALGDLVDIAGVTDNTFDGVSLQVQSIASPTSFTYNQVGADASSSGGTVDNVESFNGTINLPYITVNINKANQQGFHTGQWIKIENTATQEKHIGLTQSSQ